MRVTTHRQFDRQLDKVPGDIRAWALDWMEAAKKPGATLSEIIADASPLKGRDFRNCYVRKWRRKVPHGEYRLVFRVNEVGEEVVVFFSLEPRGDDYKAARRRIRALPH